MKMDTVKIYGLMDPRTSECRYVGRTGVGLKKRFKSHLNCAVTYPGARKCASWIASILADGLTPEIFVIEDVEKDSWQQAEKFWIAYLRFVGCNLTNMSEGGEGHEGRAHSEDVRKRLSEIGRARMSNPDVRAKHAEYAKKQWQDAAFRERKIARAKQVGASEAWRLEQSRKRKLAWERPEYRSRVEEGQRNADHRSGAIKMWQRPEYREAQALARAARKLKAAM